MESFILRIQLVKTTKDLIDRAPLIIQAPSNSKKSKQISVTMTTAGAVTDNVSKEVKEVLLHLQLPDKTVLTLHATPPQSNEVKLSRESLGRIASKFNIAMSHGCTAFIYPAGDELIFVLTPPDKDAAKKINNLYELHI